MNQKWTIRETEFIRRNLNLNPAQLHELMPDRTYKSVEQQLYKQRGEAKEAEKQKMRDFALSMFNTQADISELQKKPEKSQQQQRWEQMYAELPESNVRPILPEDIHLPEIIDFDVYSLRNGYSLGTQYLPKSSRQVA